MNVQQGDLFATPDPAPDPLLSLSTKTLRRRARELVGWGLVSRWDTRAWLLQLVWLAERCQEFGLPPAYAANWPGDLLEGLAMHGRRPPVVPAKRATAEKQKTATAV